MTDIDAIIAAGLPAAENAQPQADAEVIQTAEPADTSQDTPEEQDGEDGEQPEKKADEPFSKKAVNALSRRDRKIGKLQAELSHYKQELERFRAAKAASTAQAPTTEPQEGDYATYGDYLKAVARHEAKSERSESESKAATDSITDAEKAVRAKEQEFEQARAEVMDDSAAEARAAFPDFDKLVEKNATATRADGQTVIPMSAALRAALLEAGEHGAHALYSIFKDDVLDDLNDLSPAKAAMAVARHADKGIALATTKKVSTAPEPLAAAKGNSPGAKTLDRASPDELRAWLKSS